MFTGIVLVYRISKCFFNRWIFTQTMSQSRIINIQNGCPVTQAKGSVLKCNPPIAAGVSVLVRPNRPSRITSFVIAIIIRKPIKRMFEAWTLANIFQKTQEIISPFRANSDTASDIILTTSPIRVLATGDHILPCCIFRGFLYTRTVAMFNAVFNFKTPTRTRIAGFQLVSNDRMQSSTVTLAQPRRSFGELFANKTENLPTAKALMAYIQRWTRKWQKVNVRIINGHTISFITNSVSRLVRETQSLSRAILQLYHNFTVVAGDLITVSFTSTGAAGVATSIAAVSFELD